MRKVTIIDTSVLCELLEVPGKSSPEKSAELQDELDVRTDLGERFVVPVTALVETGNHIAQSGGDRFRTATRFDEFVRRALGDHPAFLLAELELGAEFLQAVCDGDSTGKTLPQLASERVGTGDVSILVQRDILRRDGLFEVEVWTLDGTLHDLASAT